MFNTGRKKYRCVLFDLDGTLVDTIEDIAASMNKALCANNFPQQKTENYISAVGNGIFKLAETMLPCTERSENNIKSVAQAAVKFYADEPVFYSKPYAGIQELLAYLKWNKYKTAVISNKPNHITSLVIDKLFAANTFNIVQGARGGVPNKPDPSAAWEILTNLDAMPGDTIFVGDSEVDMECARNTGCFPMGASWGYRDKEILQKSGAALIIERPDDLIEFLSTR